MDRRLVAAGCALLLASCGGLGPPTPTPRVVLVGQTPAASVAPSAAAAPFPTIPGLTAADVTLNLKEKGHACSGVQIGKVEMVSWTCRGPRDASGLLPSYDVSVWGYGPTRVAWIDATVAQVRPDDAVAAAFLGYVATMPYTGAQPQQARRWVEENIGRVDVGKPAATTIGGARFELVGPPTGRFLRIKAPGA